MKKYLIINRDNVEFSDDYQTCRTPLDPKWGKTDIFNDGYPITKDDFDDWPWLIFDYDLNILYDMAGSEKDAIEMIEDIFNGQYISYEQTQQQQIDESYKRAMSIL